MKYFSISVEQTFNEKRLLVLKRAISFFRLFILHRSYRHSRNNNIVFAYLNSIALFVKHLANISFHTIPNDRFPYFLANGQPDAKIRLLWFIENIQNKLPIRHRCSFFKYFLKFFILFYAIFFSCAFITPQLSLPLEKRPLIVQWPMQIILFFLYDDGEQELFFRSLCSYAHGNRVLCYASVCLVDTFFSYMTPP